MVVFKEMSTIWRCDLCNEEQTQDEINDILIVAKSETLEAASVHRLEHLIKNYSKLLNPNHYVVIDLKQKLAAILRNICDQERMPQPKLLGRKIELCEDILPIIRTIQPGISRLKAIALYEYFTSMAELTIHEMNDRKISINEGIVSRFPFKINL